MGHLFYIPFFLLLLMGCTEKNPDDFNVRLQKLDKKIEKLETMLDKTKDQSDKSSRIDLEIARFFSEYLQWELDHPDIMKDVLVRDRYSGIYKLTPEQKEKRYTDNINREISGSNYILDKALARIKKREQRKEPQTIDWTNVEYKNGNFRYNGRIVFPAGFNIINCNWSLVDRKKYPEWTDQDETKAQSRLYKMKDIGGALTGIGVQPLKYITGSGDVDLHQINEIADVIKNYEKEGFKVNVGFSFGATEELEKKYPGISKVSGNAVGVDIDHPALHGLIRKVMAELIPVIVNKTSVQLWDMGNEPFFRLDAWSEHGLNAYRKWLAERHGTIKELNRLWHTEYRNFSEIPCPKDKPKNDCSAGEWYDRISFHNYRVFSFYSLISEEIHRYSQDAVVHMKVQDNNSLGPKTLSITDGIDREVLGDCVDLHGLDTRPLPVTEPRMAMSESEIPILNYNDTLYGFHWLGQSFLYDFLTSLKPYHPLIDLEYHAFSINPIRIPDIGPGHAEATLWLAHLHGLVGNIVWYWHARYGPDPFPEDYLKIWLYGSVSTQPIVAAEYLHTMMDLNAFSEEITRLARPDIKPVRLFVSQPSYIQNQRHIAALHRAYEGACFHGIPMGCITEKDLSDNGVPSDVRIIIIPDAEYVSAGALAALEKAKKSGIKLIRFGRYNISMNEYGLPYPASRTAFMDDVPVLDYAAAEELSKKFTSVLHPLVEQLPVKVKDKNGTDAFGVMHRCAQYNGRSILLLINVTPKETEIELTDRSGKNINGTDLLNLEKINGRKVKLPFKGVRLIELEK